MKHCEWNKDDKTITSNLEILNKLVFCIYYLRWRSLELITTANFNAQLIKVFFPSY